MIDGSMQRSVTKEGCKLWVNFHWHSGSRKCGWAGWAGAISPVYAPRLHPHPKSSPNPPKARVLPPFPVLWSRVSWAGEEERCLEGERRRKGSGVTMASRDEFLASPEISPNLTHLRAHLVQPPHCPDWETGVRWWIRASNRLL